MRVSHLAAADELLLLGGVGVRGREVLSVMTTSRRAGLEAVIEPAASREAVSSGRRAVQSDGSAESPATHLCAPLCTTTRSLTRLTQGGTNSAQYVRASEVEYAYETVDYELAGCSM